MTKIYRYIFVIYFGFLYCSNKAIFPLRDKFQCDSEPLATLWWAHPLNTVKHPSLVNSMSATVTLLERSTVLVLTASLKGPQYGYFPVIIYPHLNSVLSLNPKHNLCPRHRREVAEWRKAEAFRADLNSHWASPQPGWPYLLFINVLVNFHHRQCCVCDGTCF